MSVTNSIYVRWVLVHVVQDCWPYRLSFLVAIFLPSLQQLYERCWKQGWADCCLQVASKSL